MKKNGVTKRTWNKNVKTFAARGMDLWDGLNKMDNGSIFISVRQRSAAFRYYNEWLGSSGYGHIEESEYLEDAYRFLNASASRDFIKFCAAKEGMEFHAYCREMEIEEERLI